MSQVVQGQTNLQLCNRLIQLAGISGSPLVTTANQVGEMARVVNWVNDSWVEIQQMQGGIWDWLQKDVTFPTVAGQRFYTAAGIGLTDWAAWFQDDDSWRIYMTSVGVGSETFLGWQDWVSFRDWWIFNANRNTQGYPIAITEKPDDHSLALGLMPDAVGYTAVGRYYSAPLAFTLDADVPAMPARFHMLIVYKAMQKYAKYESAPEVLAAGLGEFAPMYKRLIGDQERRITVGGPLF